MAVETKFDVFLSHNSKDKPTVRQLAEALQQRGLKVWLDEWELVPGRPWQEALEEIIQTTRSAVVLVGQDGMGPWEIPEMRGCLSEFASRKLPVIPVLLPDAPSQPNLPLFLKGFTWVDLRASGLSEANLNRLVWGITGRKPSSRPKPEPVPEPIPQKSNDNQVIGHKAKRDWLIGLAVVIFTGLLFGVIYKISTLPSATPPVVTNLKSVPPTNDSLPVTGKEFQDKLKDGTLGPKMVAVPAATFLMGSPAGEAGRDDDEKQHELQVADFAIGKYEVTVGQFRRFVDATGYQTEAEKGKGCYYWTGSKWKQDAGKNWQNPGFAQTNDHPVVCVSWNDAMAYVEWLKEQTNKPYRLPTEAEWEYAARAGTRTAYYWGDDPDKGCTFANAADQIAKAQLPDWTIIMECKDGYVYTVPVGRFQPNAFGLYDMLGNVREWTCSEYKDYGGAEQRCVGDNSADSSWVLRGGSWYDGPRRLRAAARDKARPTWYSLLGFRLART